MASPHEEEATKAPAANPLSKAFNATVKKEKRRMTVRLTPAQIGACVNYEEDATRIPSEEGRPKITEVVPPEELARLSPHLVEALKRMDATREERNARWAALEEDFRREREGIVQEYRAKGYVEYEVDVDDDEEVRPRRAGAGRRRSRPGVVKEAQGRVTKLNFCRIPNI